jgi:hypothetical protein
MPALDANLVRWFDRVLVLADQDGLVLRLRRPLPIEGFEVGKGGEAQAP